MGSIGAITLGVIEGVQCGRENERHAGNVAGGGKRGVCGDAAGVATEATVVATGAGGGGDGVAKAYQLSRIGEGDAEPGDDSTDL